MTKRDERNLKKGLNTVVKVMTGALENANGGIEIMIRTNMHGSDVLEQQMLMLDVTNKLIAHLTAIQSMIRRGQVLNYDMSRQQKKFDKIAPQVDAVKAKLDALISNNQMPQPIADGVEQKSQ